MARYYDMDKLKALIEAKADTLVEGKEAFLYVAKWLDLLPHEDVVPRSEVEDIEADRNKYQNWWCQTNSDLEKAKSEVAREIEALENKVGKIYNHYVFEDTDYADDDVAVEAAMNALTEVSNLIVEFKDKYTEE